jgi:sulfonate transport system substrate-binding protein
LGDKKLSIKLSKLTGVFLLLISFTLILSACNNASSTEGSSSSNEVKEKSIQIGYQKFGTLNILKAEGTLEEALEPLGFNVTWTEFPGGPQLLEALNVGSLDFGHTGEAPPIFAQAAGAPLVYFANEPANPRGEAIIVPEDSPIRSVEDLKGKKIGLNKGSNVHYLLVKALEEHGIKYGEIETAFLPPSDARAAFEQGSIDAWVIWDPFLAEAESKTGARTLVDGTGLVDNREFFLATETFSVENPEVLDVIYEEIEKAEKKIQENIAESAAFLAPQIGIDEETLEIVLERRTYGIERTTDEVINAQQQIADVFFELKLIPKKIDTSEAQISEDK